MQQVPRGNISKHPYAVLYIVGLSSTHPFHTGLYDETEEIWRSPGSEPRKTWIDYFWIIRRRFDQLRVGLVLSASAKKKKMMLRIMLGVRAENTTPTIAHKWCARVLSSPWRWLSHPIIGENWMLSQIALKKRHLLCRSLSMMTLGSPWTTSQGRKDQSWPSESTTVWKSNGIEHGSFTRYGDDMQVPECYWRVSEDSLHKCGESWQHCDSKLLVSLCKTLRRTA